MSARICRHAVLSTSSTEAGAPDSAAPVRAKRNARSKTGACSPSRGTGLGVWEVLRDFCQDDDVEALRQTFPDLSQAQLTAALMYYRRYPEEIQRQVEANARLTPEVIEREFPGLVRFIAVE